MIGDSIQFEWVCQYLIRNRCESILPIPKRDSNLVLNISRCTSIGVVMMKIRVNYIMVGYFLSPIYPIVSRIAYVRVPRPPYLNWGVTPQIRISSGWPWSTSDAERAFPRISQPVRVHFGSSCWIRNERIVDRYSVWQAVRSDTRVDAKNFSQQWCSINRDSAIISSAIRQLSIFL